MIVTSQEHTADQMATLPPKDSNQSNKLNEMRLKYGLQSDAAERDEKDEGRRYSRSTTTKANKAKKQVDDSQREEPDDAHTSFLDTKKNELMWGSVAAMLQKKVNRCGCGLTPDEAAVFEGLLVSTVDEEAADEYFSPEDTAEEKGLAVVFAFSDYKRKQAAAATKAIKVQMSSEEMASAKNLKKLKKRKAGHVALVEELNEANREKLIALTKVTGMWNALSSSERKAIGGLGEIEKELFEGIESKTLLGSLSRKLFGGVKRSIEYIADGDGEEDIASIANSLLQKVNNIMGFADDTSTLYTDETSITAETDATDDFAGKIRNLIKAASEKAASMQAASDTDTRTEYTDEYTETDDTRTEYTDDYTRDTRTTAASDPLAPIMNWLRDQTDAATDTIFPAQA